ncbi:MAG: CRISPR-associated endonuclease Cas2 [Deltaproteobacteria bacterium]|nr:CRISPR-associated endonuclease Cas2 [Deltaproteobacteria bacterium]
MRANDRWYVVVTYDVADDLRRGQVAKTLEGYGERVQKSVFDCLLDERRLATLQESLRALIDQSRDSVRYYRLCAKCERTVTVQGTGEVREDEPFVLI